MHGLFFLFNDSAASEIYSLSLHHALPILTVCNPLSSRIVRLASAVIVGGSFTGWTVTVNELVNESTPPLAVPPLSLTTKIIGAHPSSLATDQNLRLPSVSETE